MRRLRFRLVTLLLLIACLALACAWVRSEILQAKHQQVAVDSILRHGATVLYDDGSRSGEFDHWDSEGTLVAAVLGRDFRNPVRGVVFQEGATLNAETLSALREFPTITFLVLDGVKLSDDLLRHLNSFPVLRRLSLYGTSVTDSGLCYIESLESLTELNLEFTQVTDIGVSKLQQSLPTARIQHALPH